jgi:hypothetical protein
MGLTDEHTRLNRERNFTLGLLEELAEQVLLSLPKNPAEDSIQQRRIRREAENAAAWSLRLRTEDDTRGAA